MLGEGSKFSPEVSFAKGAQEALDRNATTAEKEIAKKEKEEILLTQIAEARKKAETTGDNRELLELTSLLFANSKHRATEKNP